MRNTRCALVTGVQTCALPISKPAPARPQRPSELDRLEAEIAGREAEIAELERGLAEDWADVDKPAAHRQARDELKSLPSRWERSEGRRVGTDSGRTGRSSGSPYN